MEKTGYAFEDQQVEGEIAASNDNASVVTRGGSQDRLPERDVFMGAGWDERLLQATGFSNLISESFRLLRSKLLKPPDGRPVPKSIMVTSALPQEGKSFIAANLAISLAHGVDQHCLLVDCDLRLPSLAKSLGVENHVGLVDYLRGEANLSSLIQKTAVDKLSIVASGIAPANPSELLGSSRMQDLVEELSARYPDRIVIFDSPPVNVASESIVLGQVVDGVVLVVRHGKAGKMLLHKVISDIGRDKIVGVVFNGQKQSLLASKLFYGQQSYYGGYYK